MLGGTPGLGAAARAALALPARAGGLAVILLVQDSWKRKCFPASFIGKKGKCELGDWSYKLYDWLVW